MKGTRRPLGWDLGLILLTAITLAGFGVLALYAMFYYKFHAVQPGWSVEAYQGMMNRLAAPFAVALILWLVLCIPKRLFSRRVLLGYSGAMLALGAAALPFGGWRFALGLVLGLSAALQAAILALVLAGARLHFTAGGFAMRAGSSLIHLGFVLFLFDLVAFMGSRWHIPIFWVATLLLCGGCILTFYVARRR
jgi:hypothetical protein